MHGAEVFEFEVAHGGGDIGKADRKRAAEAATLFFFTKRNDFQTLDGLQKLQDGRPARCAAGVAGAVEGDLGAEFARPFLDAQAVDQIVAQFPGAGADLLDGGAILLALEFEG